MFMRYIPADIVVRRVNFVGGGPMADGHYAVACRADTGLIYVRHGRARYCTDGGTFEVGTDDVFCLSRHAQYEFDVRNGYDVLYVNFDLVEPDGLFGCGAAMRGARSKCFDEFRRLRVAYARHDATTPLACRVLLDRILQALVREQQTQYAPSSRFRPVQQAMTFMEQHCADSALGMETVASAVGVSDGQLRRLFQELYRLSPGQYLHNLRISRAQELLTETDMTVGEVAAACGFSTLYYFSDAFHRATGASPSDYRRANRAIMTQK